MPATYTKLKNGDWGIRVTGAKPREGAVVTVTKKDGSTKVETVRRVLWSGDGIHLCAVGSGSAQTTRPTARGTNGDVYTRRNGTSGVRGCSQCSLLGDMCPQCRFDEYDD